MEWNNFCSEFVLTKKGYDYVECIDDNGLYEFNDVSIERDIYATYIVREGFSWLDDYDLIWNMTVVSIAKNIHTGKFNIVAVRD